MSTKSTLAHGKEFHLYHEVLDGDHVYLELETTHFEAGYGRVMVKIPIHIWEVIRHRGGADLTLADKSDSDLRQLVEHDVEERIRMYQEAAARGESGIRLSTLHHIFPYGSADAPREQLVARGIEYYLERRRYQQEVKARINDLEQEQPRSSGCEVDLER